LAVRRHPVLAFLLAASLLSVAACGRRNPPPVTDGPNHRIDYIIAKHYGVPSQEKYQAFIESEIGPNFTPEAFARHQENSGAVCQRDPQNGKTYCMWANFGWISVPEAGGHWRDFEIANIFCFWADPRLRPPHVRATGVGGIPLKDGDIRESRAYILSHPDLTCRDQLRRASTLDD
jgi:hypothetical protein